MGVLLLFKASCLINQLEETLTDIKQPKPVPAFGTPEYFAFLREQKEQDAQDAQTRWGQLDGMSKDELIKIIRRQHTTIITLETIRRHLEKMLKGILGGAEHIAYEHDFRCIVCNGPMLRGTTEPSHTHDCAWQNARLYLEDPRINQKSE